MEKKTITYKDAGVDIDKGNASVELIKPYVKATSRPEVIGGLGGLAAFLRLTRISMKSRFLSVVLMGLGPN